MGLDFSWSDLSLTNGELFSSHRKKVEVMEKQWDAYPFGDYKLNVSIKNHSSSRELDPSEVAEDRLT